MPQHRTFKWECGYKRKDGKSEKKHYPRRYDGINERIFYENISAAYDCKKKGGAKTMPAEKELIIGTVALMLLFAGLSWVSLEVMRFMFGVGYEIYKSI